MNKNVEYSYGKWLMNRIIGYSYGIFSIVLHITGLILLSCVSVGSIMFIMFLWRIAYE